MGSITRSLSNNITTSGVITASGITNSSVSAVTSFANASGGTLILLSTQTASNSATISFTTGLDSTYDMYEFHFININPATVDGDTFEFNLSTDSGSNYNVTKTTTAFRSGHDEADAVTQFAYVDAYDIAQGTGYQTLLEGVGNDNDQSVSGTLQLFNPSSTTYVKHFISNCNGYRHNDISANWYVAGYANTTSAVNAIRFRFQNTNMDDGIIKMYGLKKS